jgi:hypothetical protein
MGVLFTRTEVKTLKREITAPFIGLNAWFCKFAEIIKIRDPAKRGRFQGGIL